MFSALPSKRMPFSAAALAVVLLVASAAGAAEQAAAKSLPPRTAQAWTFDQAVQQMGLYPDDVYLQYVVLQLARNEGKAAAGASAIEGLNPRWGRRSDRTVDLFALMTGALAVQESLQLDTMRTGVQANAGATAERGHASRGKVPVATLAGPSVESHPWGKMLAAAQISGKAPEESELARCVPDDQYFVLFRSLTKLLEAADAGDLWGAHLLNQAAKSAKTQQTSQRLKRQLAVQTDPLTRPFYDMVVDEVAITGSDLYFREGSDVTVLFAVKQPEVFKLRMDGFLADAEKSPEAVRSTGKIGGVDYVEISTPDRAVHVFSAYPRPNLHVRSNSRVGLQRVLGAIAGSDGVKRLGDSTEMKYIRTLMVRGDEREDGLIYLSDPFIRRLVGPELKLTEYRRMLCYNHLRMIGHAAMLYRTQFGAKPKSLEQLAEAGCAPGVFGVGALGCPDGGKYELSANGAAGVCSHHGHADRLVPCCEIPLKRVTEAEANQYKQFVDQYSQYWRRYFDPIAIRLQVTPKQYRAETIILPLIDNTVYSGLAMALGGEPEPLDALPVPARNIFSLAVRLNKDALLKNQDLMRGLTLGVSSSQLQPSPSAASIQQFLARGIGNQVGMNVYDASPFFDFNLTGFLGDMMGSFRQGGGGFDNDLVPIGFMVASLNAPVYLSIPVQDARIVDNFLGELDATLAALARHRETGGWLNLDYDFYRVPLEDDDQQVRCYAVQFGPIKWRVFFARIGDGLYIASKRFILDDLAAIESRKQADASKPAGAAKQTDVGPTAHGMVRIRPEHWKDSLPAFQLGWAERSREACLDNLGPLSSVARAVAASADGPAKSAAIHREADTLHAVHFFCPDGGKYELTPDGQHVACSVHGTAEAPRQPSAPTPGSPMGQLMKAFGGATAQLTFLEDGLHAVVTIQRK